MENNETKYFSSKEVNKFSQINNKKSGELIINYLSSQPEQIKKIGNCIESII